MRLQNKLGRGFRGDEGRAVDLFAHPLRQAARLHRRPQRVAFQLQSVGRQDGVEMARVLVVGRGGRLERPLLGERRLRHGVGDAEFAIEHVAGWPADAEQAASVVAAGLRPVGDVLTGAGDRAGIGR